MRRRCRAGERRAACWVGRERELDGSACALSVTRFLCQQGPYGREPTAALIILNDPHPTRATPFVTCTGVDAVVDQPREVCFRLAGMKQGCNPRAVLFRTNPCVVLSRTNAYGCRRHGVRAASVFLGWRRQKGCDRRSAGRTGKAALGPRLLSAISAEAAAQPRMCRVQVEGRAAFSMNRAKAARSAPSQSTPSSRGARRVRG